MTGGSQQPKALQRVDLGIGVRRVGVYVLGLGKERLEIIGYVFMRYIHFVYSLQG